jgi:hypothetical protein
VAMAARERSGTRRRVPCDTGRENGDEGPKTDLRGSASKAGQRLFAGTMRPQLGRPGKDPAETIGWRAASLQAPASRPKCSTEPQWSVRAAVDARTGATEGEVVASSRLGTSPERTGQQMPCRRHPPLKNRSAEELSRLQARFWAASPDMGLPPGLPRQ